MALLSTVMYIGVAILILLFMITVHELGHYLAGKLLGFKINEFAIGFGKPIFKKVNKKTGEVFSVRWLPLGGYCGFAGDEAAAGEGGSRAEALEREKAAAANGEAVPTPKGVDFNKQPPWKRLIVLFAGAFFNFLCAILFAVILLMIVGYNQSYSITEIKKTSSGADNPNYAFFKEIDTIYGIGLTEESVQKFTLLRSFSSVVNKHKESDTLVYHVKFTDGTVGYESYSFKIEKFTRYDEKTKKNVEYPGIGINTAIIYQPLGLFKAIGYGAWFCLEISWLILSFLGQLVIGKVRFFGDVGGPTATIGVMTEMVSASFLNIFQLVPLISVNLALFNLLPIPALDGARMVFVGIEWVRGKPINPEIEGRIHMFGLLFLLAVVVIADIGFWVMGSGGIFSLLCRFLL